MVKNIYMIESNQHVRWQISFFVLGGKLPHTWQKTEGGRERAREEDISGRKLLDPQTSQAALDQPVSDTSHFKNR